MEEKLCTKILALLGQEVVIEGRRFQVHELLKDSETLVLMPVERSYTIQADQYGDPRRRTHETLTVPIMSELADELHPVLKQILEQGQAS
jgi:hypothetical protein